MAGYLISARLACLKRHVVVSVAGGASTYIRSIQQVSIRVDNSALSNTATISSVGPLAFVIYNGVKTAELSVGTAVLSGIYSRVELTNSSTVTVTRGVAASTSVTLLATVIDPTSALVSSVQMGSVTIPSSAITASQTITSVDTAKSALFFLGSEGNIGFGQQLKTTALLANASTVTVATSASISAACSIKVGYALVSFVGGAIQSIQTKNTSFVQNASVTNTDTITNVNMNNTMIAYGGHRSNTQNFRTVESYVALADASSVVYVRQTPVSGSATFQNAITVVEFAAGVLKSSVQRGILTIVSGGTAAFGTITSVQSSVSFINFLGHASPTTLFTTPGANMPAVALTPPGSVAATRSTGSNSADLLVSYEVLEFN